MTEPSYTCPICGKESFHPVDLDKGYCSACHAFTRDCTIGTCRRRGAVVAGNVALCADHALELGVSA